MMMKRKIPFAVIAVLFIVCLLSGIFNTPIYAKAETTAETDIYSEIDAYLQTCAKNARIPAMSVTIVDKDNVLLAQSYGECESCNTPFLLGSVSKSFTAVCVMQLVEQGKIDLNASIRSGRFHNGDHFNIVARCRQYNKAV